MNHLSIASHKTVLVLNSSYEPINHTSWKRAILLVLKDKAYVLSPRTIRLKNYVKLPVSKLTANKPSRTLVLKRDACCQYCESRKNLTIDHVLPKSRGGGDTWENMVAACIDCNNAKDNRTPEEWAAEIQRVLADKVLKTSVVPSTWSSFELGMLEARINSRGTTLMRKPKAPYNKMSLSLKTSEVPEWCEYLFQ
jgi:hypothetical protein